MPTTHLYDAQSCIELPRFTATIALTTGTKLISAAAGKKLPANVLAGLKHLERTTTDLQSAVFSSEDDAGAPTYAEEARRETSAWSAAWAWAKSVAKLSNEEKAAKAEEILELLFSEGVVFVRLPTAERWIQTGHRIHTIATNKLAAVFTELGGGDFVADILETHKALGVAAGITAPRETAAKSGVQQAFDRWKAAARCYVAQLVANHALALMNDPEDTAADALAKKLLEPLTSIETSSVRASGEGTGDGQTDEKEGAKKGGAKKSAGKKGKAAADAADADKTKPADAKPAGDTQS